MSDYADSPAFGSNKVAAAEGDEAIAHAADYREPKQMTKMEDPPSPMELFLHKTKLRLAAWHRGKEVLRLITFKIQI